MAPASSSLAGFTGAVLVAAISRLLLMTLNFIYKETGHRKEGGKRKCQHTGQLYMSASAFQQLSEQSTEYLSTPASSLR